MELCHCLHTRNLRIPQDVSVITFNNPPLARFSAPPATCVEIPFRAMGVEAGGLLLRKLEHPATRPGEVKMLPGKLVIRDSAAPVKQP